MNNKINFECPVNNLSFGNVSYNLLLAFTKIGVDFDFCPIGDKLDFSAFNKSTDEFRNLITQKAQNFGKTYSRKNPTLKLWHIQGSQASIGVANNLFTFFELDSLTPHEVNLLNQQASIFVSSEEAKQVMIDFGVKTKITYCPLGYDTEHFYATGKKYLDPKITVFGINAKYEEIRKSHRQVIQGWIKKYKNNSSYRLHLHIWNSFFSPEQNQQVAASLVGNEQIDNLSFFPYTRTLGELNDAFNAMDVIIDGSGGEGWSLGSFHACGLGKHSLVHNCSAMKGWANAENSTLIESSGKRDVADGIFFHKGAPFNQGNIYTFTDEDYFKGLDEVVAKSRANKVNTPGLKLREDFTWEKTAKIILDNLV